MPAPLAVAPSNPRPGMYIVVNFLRGATSPGAAGLRAAIVSPPATAGGDITVGTEVRSVFSAEEVETACGKAPAYFAYKAIQANDNQALVDLVVCAASAGAAAAQTLTFAGAPTSNQSFRLWIQGVSIELTWNVGEAATVARDNAILRINEKAADIFVVASAGAGGVVNLTARSTGPIGNDVRLRVKLIAGAGGTATLGGATLAGGTTEVDMSTALSSLSVKEYDFILPCVSNADAQSSSATANPGRLATHIDNNLTGSTAKLQQGLYGSTGTIAQAKVNAVARNHTNLEHILSVNDESLPCELAGAELGDRMRRRRLESNANRVLQPLKRVRGSADPAGDQPTDAEATDALNNGVSLVGYNASNAPILLRSVTTHSLDTGGNPDRRAFDTNEIDALYDYAKDMRAALPQEFQSPDGQVKIMKNRQEGDDPLPAGTVEERDVRAFVVNRTLEFWVPKGVIDGAKFQTAADSGDLICEINASDPTQLDLFVPAAALKILAKIGFYLAKAA
jgi:phage tail sheath gpL-like